MADGYNIFEKEIFLFMKENYIEKIYAGWLTKIIGIRLGAPIEG